MPALLLTLLGLLAWTALPAAAGPATEGAAASPFEPPRDQWHAENDTGHWQNGDRVRIDEACLGLPDAEAVACSLEVFETKPFVVIAFVDTGINPYHHDFRAPEFVHHPSTYVEGFPDTAEAIDVSFEVADEAGYNAARAADDGMWASLRRNQLYWIPGTRIVGAYGVAAGGTSAGRPERVILDDQGHGTGVASVAAGAFYGSNPNALIVAVEGLGTGPLNWAASQPWIDIVSNSWGPGLPGRIDPLGNVDPTRQSTRRGQTVLFSAGNGMQNTNSSDVLPPAADPCRCKIPPHNVSWTSYTSGPSWIVTVGAASPINGQAHWWHGIPVDVMSFGSKWSAAHAFGVTIDDNRDFGGTSCATPITAGVLSSVIETARDVFGDSVQGQRAGKPGVVAEAAEGAVLPEDGPLADGVLTQPDARAIVERTAFPVVPEPEHLTWDYAVVPTTDAYWVQQGYGLVDRDSKALALEVLLGEQPLPDRPDAEAWQAHNDTIRNQIYGNP